MNRIHVMTVARFSADGRVWRSFDHLIAAAPGRLLLVPIGLSDGDLTQVVDGCPVPWPEVWAVIDAPAEHAQPVQPARLAALCPLAAAHFLPYGWLRDVVTAGATVPTMTRLTCPDGVRVALLGRARHE